MNTTVKNTLAVLAIAGGAQHLLLGVFKYDLVGMISSFLPSWGGMLIFGLAGASGVYAGVKLFK